MHELRKPTFAKPSVKRTRALSNLVVFSERGAFSLSEFPSLYLTESIAKIEGLEVRGALIAWNDAEEWSFLPGFSKAVETECFESAYWCPTAAAVAETSSPPRRTR